MDSPRYEVAGPVEDRGVVVRGARAVRRWIRRAWIAACYGLSVLSFVMLGVVSLVFVESLFAEYSLGDMHLRVFLPGIVLIITGLPASQLLQWEQLRSFGRFIKHLLFWKKTTNKKREQLLPRWVRHGNLVLGGHAMVNFVLTIYVTRGGWVKETNGRYFAVEGDHVQDLTLEEAQLLLSFWISMFAAGYVIFFFGYGWTYWFHRKRLQED